MFALILTPDGFALVSANQETIPSPFTIREPPVPPKIWHPPSLYGEPSIYEVVAELVGSMDDSYLN